MILHSESRRRHRFYSCKALFKFEDPAADAAEKVMVMTLVGALVTGQLPGNFHTDNPSISGERLQRTIHGGNSETWGLPDREALNLRWG